MKSKLRLSDEAWAAIEPLLPKKRHLGVRHETA
jgi:hypothetical protein